MCFTRPHEPKSVVDTLLCPKFIVYDQLTLYCVPNFIVYDQLTLYSVPNLTSVVTGLILIFFFIWRFTGLEGIILDVKYWGALPPPPSSYAPAIIHDEEVERGELILVYQKGGWRGGGEKLLLSICP